MLELLSTPIFYVNAAPHLGHLYSIVLTDVARRWKGLNGVPCVMSTGTDEHGTKVARAASQQQMQPKEHADIHSAQFMRLAQRCGANATFVRTTDRLHNAHAVDLWNKLDAAGMLYRGQHSGYYCVSDECFYSVDELVKNANGKLISRMSGHSVEWLEESNWFFKLREMQPKLIDLYQSRDFVLPSSRHARILQELKSGPLSDLSISRPRSRVPWGVPVPTKNGEESLDTMYVWFDALANYLTACTMNGGCDSMTHIVGKDIQKFHAIYWPAFLMAAGLEVPEHIVVHSHWTADGVKMSKSLGNVVDPLALIDKLGSDSVRYALCFDSTLENDSSFSLSRAIERHNVNIVNKWSNLASRACSPKFDVPRALEIARETFTGPNLPGDNLIEKCSADAKDYEFGKYLHKLNEAAMSANVRIQHAAPWKQPESVQSALAIADAVDTCRLLAILLQPVCPVYATRMLDSLGVAKDKRFIAHAQKFADTDYVPRFRPVAARIING